MDLEERPLSFYLIPYPEKQIQRGCFSTVAMTGCVLGWGRGEDGTKERSRGYRGADKPA